MIEYGAMIGQNSIPGISKKAQATTRDSHPITAL